MEQYITIPFYKGKALEEEIKVHDTLKEAKRYANKYLASHGEGYSINITEF